MRDENNIFYTGKPNVFERAESDRIIFARNIPEWFQEWSVNIAGHGEVNNIFY